jgi:hypothetical protein
LTFIWLLYGVEAERLISDNSVESKASPVSALGREIISQVIFVIVGLETTLGELMSVPYVCSRCRTALHSRMRVQNLQGRDFTSLTNKKSNQQISERTIGGDDSPKGASDDGKAPKLRYSRKPMRPLLSGKLKESSELVKGTSSSTRQSKSQTPKKEVAWSSSDFRARDKDAANLPQGLNELFLRTEAISPGMVQPPRQTLPREQGLAELFLRTKKLPQSTTESRGHELQRGFVKTKLKELAQEFRVRDAFEIMKQLRAEQGKSSTYESLLLKRDPVFEGQLKRFVDARTQEASYDGPTLVEVVKLYDDMGVLNPKRLHYIISSLIRIVLSSFHDGQNGANQAQGIDGDAQIPSKQERYQHLHRTLQDLLCVWQSMSNHFLSPAARQHETPSWEGLPGPEDVEKMLAGRNPGWDGRFSLMLPGHYVKALGYSFASDALMTLYCFRKAKHEGYIDDQLEEDAFIQHLDVLRQGIHWTHPSALNDRILDIEFGRTAGGVKIDVPLLIRNEFAKKEQSPTVMGVVEAEDFNFKSGKLFSDLRKATKEDDTRFIIKLWDRRGEWEDGRDKRFISLLYEEFLWSFVKVVRLDKAIEVWGALKKQGITPTIGHWTAMIEACRRNKDIGSLNSIWAQLNASGLEITNTAHSTYLTALLHCREWQQAIKAVQSLINSWGSGKQPAVEDAQDATVEVEHGPSILPINAVVTGLLKLNRPQVADSLLAFAEERGIEPSVATFNIRLRAAVRKDDGDRVQQLLAELERSACTPDTVTFTTLVDGLFRGRQSKFGTQTTAEQHAAVDQVFRDMHAAGIKATAYTYAIVLDSLLPHSFPNLAAARAVLERMARQKIPVSPHICAILVQHYFNSEPPDLGSIQDLWQRMEQEKTVPDHVFFDRVIEGYARLGESAEVMRFLRLMPRRGKLPGWISLTMALRCLARQGEYETANELVGDVERQDGMMRFGVRRGWKGEHDFHSLVAHLRETGVLEARRPEGPREEDGVMSMAL